MKAKGFTPSRQCAGAGFSLVEVLVAMLILTLFTAGMFGIFVGGKGFVIRAGRKTEAINFARERMEELKSRAYVGVSGGSETVHFSGGMPATRTWTVTPVTEGKRVTVTVTWTEPGIDPKIEEIVTLVANPG